MAEQKTAQQAVREQFMVVENAAENVFKAWSDLAASTAGFTFDAVEKSIHYGEEALTSYRKVYEDGLKTWQSYVQGVNDIFKRPS